MEITASILASKEAELRNAEFCASLAYSNMCRARVDIESAKEGMAKYFKDALNVRDEYKTLWTRYIKVKHTCDQKIQAQNELCRSNHEEMSKFLRWSKNALTYGDYEDYERYQQEARICQERRDRAASKVARYIKIARVAREYINRSEVNIASRRYYDARRDFKDAENRYGINYEAFYHFEAKSVQLDLELKNLKKDYRKQKRTLERCRQNKASERLDILNASSVNEAFYGNVKIKFRVERGVPTYHIYYSTTKKPDGDYHGHSVIEEIDGKFRERYHRHPLSEHGRQNVVGPNED